MTREQKQHLGEAVKELREMLDLSMRDLAKKSGVSASFISRLESADSWNTTINNLSKVADALGLSLAELMNYQVTPKVKCDKCQGRGWVFK